MKTAKHILRHFARWLIIPVLAWILPAWLTAPAFALATQNHPASSPPGNIPATLPPRSAGEEDIRDIRPPYHIPPGWLWLAWVTAGAGLGALAYGAWRRSRRAVPIIKLPYELALERLEEARRWMQPEHARAFSIAVSEIVRDYIEQSFPLRAAHRTTGEFLRDLATRPEPALAQHQPMLRDFLGYCDLAKFARWTLSATQMEAMLRSATDFIVATGKPGPIIPPVQPVDTPHQTPSPGASTVAPVSLSIATGPGMAAQATLETTAS